MIRLDEFLFEKGFFDSRTKAKQSIVRKEIFVNGKNVDKPSTLVDEKVEIKIVAEKRFVSLGGYKLDKALDDFEFNVRGLTCADVGASTGGFTDCLLQKGASKVYAVDLNADLLHNSLKNDSRVVEVIANAKDLSKDSFACNIDLITADLSFISAKSVMGVFSSLLDYNANLILLIKPQFENDAKIKFKNGIVRDCKLRFDACIKVVNCAVQNGFYPLKITSAPKNKDKNEEYLILLTKSLEKVSNQKLSEFNNFIHKLTNNY